MDRDRLGPERATRLGVPELVSERPAPVPKDVVAAVPIDVSHDWLCPGRSVERSARDGRVRVQPPRPRWRSWLGGYSEERLATRRRAERAQLVPQAQWSGQERPAGQAPQHEAVAFRPCAGYEQVVTGTATESTRGDRGGAADASRRRAAHSGRRGDHDSHHVEVVVDVLAVSALEPQHGRVATRADDHDRSDVVGLGVVRHRLPGPGGTFVGRSALVDLPMRQPVRARDDSLAVPRVDVGRHEQVVRVRGIDRRDAGVVLLACVELAATERRLAYQPAGAGPAADVVPVVVSPGAGRGRRSRQPHRERDDRATRPVLLDVHRPCVGIGGTTGRGRRSVEHRRQLGESDRPVQRAEVVAVRGMHPAARMYPARTERPLMSEGWPWEAMKSIRSTPLPE